MNIQDEIEKEKKQGFMISKSFAVDWDGWLEKKYKQLKAWWQARKEKKDA